MSRLPTTTSAMTALAALTSTEQDLNQVENHASAGYLANMLMAVETVGSITTAASSLGATTINLTSQRTYVSNLSDSLIAGVASLVDANMNEAATKLAALQVQQRLDVQALSVSNSNNPADPEADPT